MALWIAGGIAVALVIYIVLRVLWVYYICGGNEQMEDYYD